MNEAKLSELFGGMKRFSLLRLLYLNPARQYTNKEVVALSGVVAGNASRWLKRWSELGLVRMTVDGRNITFQAADDPLLLGLTDLFLRNDAILRDIQDALPPEVDIAVIFGSVARGNEKAESDIDILALGTDLSSIRVNAALRPVGRAHNRVINVSVHSKAEFEQLLQGDDSFAKNIVGQKIIKVKGEFNHAFAETK